MKQLFKRFAQGLSRWFRLESEEDQRLHYHCLDEYTDYIAAENLRLLRIYSLSSIVLFLIMMIMRCIVSGVALATIFPSALACTVMLGIRLLLNNKICSKRTIPMAYALCFVFTFTWYAASLHYDIFVSARQSMAMTYLSFVIMPLLFNCRPIDNILGSMCAYAITIMLSAARCPFDIVHQNFFYCLVAGVVGICISQRKTANDLRQRHYLDMYQSASRISILVVQVNLKQDSFRVLQCPDYMTDGMTLSNSAADTAEIIRTNFISPEFRQEYARFINLSDMAERLSEHDALSMFFMDFRGRWCQLILSAQHKVNGVVTDFIATVRDVDEEKRRELEYQHQLRVAKRAAEQANAAKTNFLSRMTHDIRTPLNGIIGLLRINQAHSDDIALVNANQQKMMVSANHLLSLINDMLEMSKLEDGKIVLSHEAIDLRKLAMDVATIADQRAVEFSVKVTFNMDWNQLTHPFVYTSPLHLRQLFLNIYSNCIKYNHPGGSVNTHFRCLGTSDGKVTYRWTISDTGIGMSQEFLKHMFEPFSQERQDARSVYNGTGLGMAIVKSLIDNMNGTIKVNSEQGKGSTFDITLPFEIASEAECTQSATPAIDEQGIHGLKLLLAEDNELNAEIANTLLSDEGAIVSTVGDGKQALEAFETAQPGTYDAILMDVMMPVMDGLGATRAIRALERPDAQTIPIIALTANAFAEDAQRCVDAGMNAHISKPLQMEAVISVLSGLCKRN